MGTPVLLDPNEKHIRHGHTGPRWVTLRPHEEQQRYWNSTARFIIVPAGRRSGKTEIAKRRIVRAALSEVVWPDARFGALAPTNKQAKKIYWDDLKKMVPMRFQSKKPSESDLTIFLTNGATITVAGLDEPARIEGHPWNGLILDEYGNMKPEAWLNNVRPALADRNGWAMFIGVPEGRNHYWDLYCKAKEGNDPDWEIYEWSAEDILPEKEIESLKRDLDPLTYDQEIRGRFVDFQGGAYYAFKSAEHIAQDIKYNTRQPLRIGLDFNVAPGVAIVCQEAFLYDNEETQEIGVDIGDRRVVHVIDEIYIPNNSNTPMVMNKLAEKYGGHQGEVIFYGDATGGAKGTAKIGGSDWDLVGAGARVIWPGRYMIKVPKKNPPERSRVASVNTVFHRNRCFVSPLCKNFIRDLQGVRLVKSGDGSLDKKSDATLTHISDAFGYYIAREFPIREAFTRFTEI